MQNITIYAAMIFSGARYGQNLADMGSHIPSLKYRSIAFS